MLQAREVQLRYESKLQEAQEALGAQYIAGERQYGCMNGGGSQWQKKRGTSWVEVPAADPIASQCE